MTDPRTIPEIPLVLAPETPEARAAVGYKWAEPEIGKRSKIGGKPLWLQKPQVPECSCRKPMTFYGQLDSVGSDFDLADCGLIYVFVCFDCFETKSLLQSC
jgi:uncharacterized protein YwqG